ncbi:hypothetical protein O181_118664 [Austropuccinia psidii MF-1]|uniref:Uncharacterized protein n=1 Tax=Austropuccinia psidii MF-1 TaxID=1389203 RepID=A0A9Q3KFQ0_9BASI|nr:hypothetical protein [Austropuccinia psidii MF-1]
MSIINVTVGERNLNSHPDTAALNSLQEISLKYKITINKDLKPQENHIIKEESINSISKPKQYEEFNKSLENFIVNQTTNGNDHGEETEKKDSRKTNINFNMDKSKPVLPQEVTRSPNEF